MDPLLDPITLSDLTLTNRVWMAPLTRARSSMPGNVPNELMATYYAQRASAGLIIAEATPISERAHGYYSTPGIHTDAQEEGWRAVTDAVHDCGGRIVLQLWHVGRMSHHALQPNNERPLGATDAASESKTYIDATFERVQVTPPRALRDDEIPMIVQEYADATRRAKRAGFDGVEIHGANSYLLDQFTRDGINTRSGAYGGSLANRLRFPLEAAQAVVDAWGDPKRVGYRIAPLSEHNDVRDSDPLTTFSTLAKELGSLGLGFLHAVETWDRSDLDHRVDRVIPKIAEAFKSAGGDHYIANGDYSVQLARESIASGWCDAVAFGKAFISNPDLPERIGVGAPLAEWDTGTFYGGGAEGYTDYPALDTSTEGSTT